MRYTLLTSLISTVLGLSTVQIGAIAAPLQSLSQRDVVDALQERCVANRRGGGAADDGNELLLRQVVATPQGWGPCALSVSGTMDLVKFVPDTDVRPTTSVQRLPQRSVGALQERCEANRRGGGAADNRNKLLPRQVVSPPEAPEGPQGEPAEHKQTAYNADVYSIMQPEIAEQALPIARLPRYFNGNRCMGVVDKSPLSRTAKTPQVHERTANYIDSECRASMRTSSVQDRRERAPDEPRARHPAFEDCGAPRSLPAR
ncbi:hypothetical protein DFP72DRAFT_1100435 [Ephemerocybe angulata]|uniref:Uncharacterized protein n=1 Tax=Ephemerocybe angulata TaxID=980116 RepID=A0A8H6LUM8_9AGAR|nr:hypothetical protein DFP72DRAFT_1100435 [Tulosesus angulatus]